MLKKRTRLSPHNRRMQLLDSAASIIIERGMSSLTMESVAIKANVSNPLIYKYFDSRIALLRELLIREYQKYVSDYIKGLEGHDDFRHAIYGIVTADFDKFTKNDILDILKSQPDVRTVAKEFETKEVRNLGQIIIKMVMASYSIPEEHAMQVVLMGSGASKAAGEYYRNNGGDKELMIENVVQFIFGGIEKLINK